jgi:hypothetical protein
MPLAVALRPVVMMAAQLMVVDIAEHVVAHSRHRLRRSTTFFVIRNGYENNR